MSNDRLLKVGKFEVDRHGMTDIQILLMVLASDPTEKQKVVLDAFDVKILDYNGKPIYPQPEPLKNVAPE